MVGYGNNRGIVPISCEEIFRRIGENEDPSRRFEILVSMVEIYNECVQDLTLDPADRVEGGLKVRESKALGVYVDGVRKKAVESYTEIEEVIEQASAHRTLGATLMNATSSRGHTVTSIEFKQVAQVGKTESVKLSIINLVDLAGSEKAAQTGATGDRLKEGALINKSLSALGAVISKLAEKSTAKKGAKEISVPYRDSKLTRLLSNALGGSSKTIMICALSPASSNFQETLSTLRYADRAKQIKNTAVVNENPQDKLIREMREENAKLKAMIESGGAMVDASLIQEKQEELAQLAKALEESKRSFEERLQERREEEKHLSVHRSTIRRTAGAFGLSHPQLVNLNEQVQLSCRLKYELSPGSCYRICCGPESSSGEEDEDDSNENESSSSSSGGQDDAPSTILIPGHLVLEKHAKISCFGERQCFVSCSEFSAQVTWVNGVSLNNWREEHTPIRHGRRKMAEDSSSKDRFRFRRMDSERIVAELKHGDYVTFGRATFLFADPREGLPETMIVSGQASFCKAKKQLPPTWRQETSKVGLCGDDTDGLSSAASGSGGNITELILQDRDKDALQGELEALRSDLHLAQKDRNASEDARKKAENECAVLRQQLKAANEARKRAEQCARGAEAWTKEQPERLPPSVLPNDNSDELTKNDSALVMAKDAQIAELQNQVKELNKALSLRRREKCLESPRQREAMDGQGADSFYPTDGWADLSGLTTTIKTSFDDAISALDSAQFYLDRNSSSAAVPKRHTHLVF
eukprot:TRINITY_DN10934_c0_g1_i1.p1 TRINITY_DN10934_c0_g1~~TRINITY_DN10934_c0_g1_i1.p1  ORF type:complete len:882 (+),score=141.20 TRINITY_DN10934_c0_g1_i1:376-2646(+)